MSMFFTLEKLVLKSGSTPCYLSSFSSFFLSQSRQLLDIWWIDRESSCLLNSFSTLGGSIELLLLDLMSCSSIPQLSMTISLIPTSIASSTPLDTCIYRALLRVYIYFLRNPILISSISLDLSAPIHPPNTLSLSHFKPLPLWFFKLFQDSPSLGKFLISHSSCISCFET